MNLVLLETRKKLVIVTLYNINLKVSVKPIFCFRDVCSFVSNNKILCGGVLTRPYDFTGRTPQWSTKRGDYIRNGDDDPKMVSDDRRFKTHELADLVGF